MRFFEWKGNQYRLLWVDDECGYLIDCKATLAPYKVSLQELSRMQAITSPLAFIDDNFLTDGQKRLRDKRYSYIADVVDDLPAMLDSGYRNQALKKIVERENVTLRTLCKYLYQCWVYGSKNVLAPKSRDGRNPAEMTDLEKIMRRALNKYYYSPQKLSLQTAYEKMLKENFVDEKGVLTDGYPSFWKFRYFFRTHRYPSKEIISRYGRKHYDKYYRAMRSLIPFLYGFSAM